jgi:hypothetical protein
MYAPHQYLCPSPSPAGKEKLVKATMLSKKLSMNGAMRAYMKGKTKRTKTKKGMRDSCFWKW